jgi:putative ABC transport system permease protein
MSLLDVLRYRWRVLTHPRQHEQEVGEEMDFHVHLETMQREHAARGTLSRAEARYAARRRFGNVTHYQEEARRASGLETLDTLLQDARFALRTFRGAPMFTTVAVLTLAIGIGANTAMFSAIDTLLLRPLPFREPDRLMAVSLTRTVGQSGPTRDDLSWSYLKFEVLRNAQSVFVDAALWRASMFTARATDEALRVNGEYVDSHYLPALGIQPILGRTFTAAEDRDFGGARVVILSYQLWQQLFNAESTVLGRTLDVDGIPYTVVGVAPSTFRGLSGESTLWMPIASMPVGWHVPDPWSHNYYAVARLAPGVPAERAMAVVAALGRRIDATYPDKNRAARWGATTRPLDAARVDGRVRRTLFILFGAVGLVLLIACANVANLFLVRASARRREIAVRLAIGAGRWRLVRQLLVESVLLSLSGGVASLAVAWAGAKALSTLQPASALRSENVSGLGLVNFSAIQLNATAFLFTAAVAAATGILFGLVPALQATRPALSEALKDDGAAQSIRVRGLISRNVLTVVEIALCVVLLAGSGLMMRSLDRLLSVPTGFDGNHVLTLQVNRAPSWSRDSIIKFYDVALERLARVPGVADVAMADCPPLWACSGSSIVFHDRAASAPGADKGAGTHWITPGWLSLVHVPLIRGRMFTRDDIVGRRRAVLVSEAAARAFWPGQDPLGRALSVLDADTAYVVGVVGDVLYGSMELPPQPEVYVSYYQVPFSYRMMFFLKTRVDPASVGMAARRALNEVAPGFPVYDIRPLDGQVEAATAYARVSTVLLGIFAVLALALATMGTYGVISFAVAQRTREIGVRIALGATSGDVARLVVGQGIVLAAVGAVFGLAGAFGLTRLLRSLLYGVEPTDPMTLGGIVVILVLSVLAASWLPARRAAGTPVVDALRGG